MNLKETFAGEYDPQTLDDLQAIYDRKLIQQFDRLRDDIAIDPIEELPFPARFSANGIESWAIDRLGTDRFIEENWDRLLASDIRLIFVVHDTAGIANPGTSMENFMIEEWCADNTGTGIEDDHDHWTNVASMIAGNLPGTKIGILRRLFEAKKAFLVGDKVLSRGSGSFNWILAGINRTMALPYQENDFVIHVNSYGALGASSQAISNALVKLTAAGQVFLASSGNSGHDPAGRSRVGFPASDDNAIAVGATDRNDNRKIYSSTGEEVYSTAPSGVPGINRDGSVSNKEGTSFSQPINAALVGLIALYENRKFTQEEVEELIRTRSIDLGQQGRDTFFGYGIQTEETFAAPGDDPGDVDPEPPAGPTLPPYVLTTKLHQLTERWYYDSDLGTGRDPRTLLFNSLTLAVATEKPADLGTIETGAKVAQWMDNHILVVPNDWSINQVAAITTRFIDMKMDQNHGITVHPLAAEVAPNATTEDVYLLNDHDLGEWKETPEEEIRKLGVRTI